MLAMIDQTLDALAHVDAIRTRLLLESLCARHGGACTHVHVWGVGAPLGSQMASKRRRV
jgi:hypothetical protein